MIVQFRFRRGTATEWITANPVLEEGEPGIDLTSGGFKLGDGVSPWNDLAYQSYSPEELNDLLADMTAQATAASTAASSAATAAASAQSALAEFEAVEATTDGIITAIAEDPASDFAQYLATEFTGGGGSGGTVKQVTDNVIPVRPTADPDVVIVFQCWDDPAVNALEDDIWRVVTQP